MATLSPVSSGTFRPTPKRLLGAGPSPLHPRVIEAMCRPQVGHLDPEFLVLMEDTQRLLRELFRTTSPLAMAISGTGSAGMEAVLVNLIEPGDEVVVGVAGYFGARIAEMTERCGAVLHRLDLPWGRVFTAEAIRAALDAHPRARMVALVQGETSAGTWQPLAEIAAVCREHDALLLADVVASLGGVAFELDAWGVDAAWSGSQKCLSAPPGLAPVALGERALAKLRGRRSKVRSWYLDLSLLETYWTTGRRAYHHTAPILMNYALHEALRLAVEEGLEARIARHARMSRALIAGMEALGFALLAAPDCRLPVLNAFLVPAGLDEAGLRRQLLAEHAIEISGGLGELAGKLWRIGMMGEGARPDQVRAVLAAVELLLRREGRLARLGEGLEAAERQLAD